jgi:hypothetical protein
VAYLLCANEEFLTFAEVSSSALFAGVIMCKLADVDALKTETIYLGELVKSITDDSLYQQAAKAIENISDFTFDGFASGFEGADTLLEIVDENEDTFVGRVMAHDENVLVLDEYYTENDRRFAHSYINFATIIRLGINVPWVRTVARSLADKNI